MEVYGSVLSEVQNDLAKMLETRRLSKPTKTLEGLKKEGTIDISNPEVADEFTRFMRESDPKGYKDLEQKVDLSNLDIKGKKGHASGGIAGQLHMNRPGYAQGIGPVGPKTKRHYKTMPEIDPYLNKFFRRRNKLMKFKDSKGLAEILGV